MRTTIPLSLFTAAVLILITLSSSADAQTSSIAAAPPGATGLCRDGMYTFSKEKRGSCKGRQGVQEWFAEPSTAESVNDAKDFARAKVTPPLPSSIPENAPGRNLRILVVYMGGNDCPPCVHWRANDLPRLKTTEAFRSVTFSYVQKTIQSSVPPSMFLPDEVKPLKGQLDAAGGGRGGSAQVAIVVDGQVYDYYFGARSADEVEQMILSIRNGTKYPFERCLKRDADKGCSLKAS